MVVFGVRVRSAGLRMERKDNLKSNFALAGTEEGKSSFEWLLDVRMLGIGRKKKYYGVAAIVGSLLLLQRRNYLVWDTSCHVLFGAVEPKVIGMGRRLGM